MKIVILPNREHNERDSANGHTYVMVLQLDHRATITCRGQEGEVRPSIDPKGVMIVGRIEDDTERF